MNDYGIVDGYHDGTFKPENRVTTAENSCIIQNPIKTIHGEGWTWIPGGGPCIILKKTGAGRTQLLEYLEFIESTDQGSTASDVVPPSLTVVTPGDKAGAVVFVASRTNEVRPSRKTEFAAVQLIKI